MARKIDDHSPHDRPKHRSRGRMTEISRAALFGKLNPLAYKAIEGATVFCKLRGNPYVELVHWLHQILQTPGFRPAPHRPAFRARPVAGWPRDITAALDRLPRGATAISDFSPQIEEAVERGWVFATLMFGEAQVRTGHLLLGMLQDHARCATRCYAHQPRSSRRSRPRRWPTSSRRSSPARRKPRSPPPTARQSARLPAKPAARWPRPPMGKQEALAQILRRPDRAGAQGRDRSRSSAATRRSARSSTS